MGRAFALCMVTVLAVGAWTWPVSAQEPGRSPEPPPDLQLQLPLATQKPAVRGTVYAVHPNGGFTISPPRDPFAKLGNPLLKAEDRGGVATEGYYIGIVGEQLPSLVDAQLLRLQVYEVRKDGKIMARGGKNLNRKIKRGAHILLVRPLDTTTAQMESLPDLISIEEAPSGSVSPAEIQPVVQTRSIMNLQKINRAMQKLYAVSRQFPPASLAGPDGKPWHSWRVLLLMYLEEEPLFRSYRFDEPWDGPNNKKLLDAMPPVYTDQPPDRITDHFTRYALVTGKGMTFSSEGFPFDGKRLQSRKGTGTNLMQVVDGAANTLALGTISPEAKIPWTKPADVVIVGDGRLQIGSPGGFAAPYRNGDGDFALFGRVDGGIFGIRKDIDGDVLRSLFTIADGGPLDPSKLEELFVPKPMAMVEEGPVIYTLPRGRSGHGATHPLTSPQVLRAVETFTIRPATFIACCSRPVSPAALRTTCESRRRVC